MSPQMLLDSVQGKMGAVFGSAEKCRLQMQQIHFRAKWMHVAGSAKDAISDAVDSAKDKVKDVASDAVDSVQGKMDAVVDSAKDAVSDAVDSAKDKVKDCSAESTRSRSSGQNLSKNRIVQSIRSMMPSVVSKMQWQEPALPQGSRLKINFQRCFRGS